MRLNLADPQPGLSLSPSFRQFFDDCRKGLQAFLKEPRWLLLTLAAIFVIAFVVRASYLSQPMRRDESFTYIELASRSLIDGLSKYPEPNNHLLNTLMVHLSCIPAGANICQPWMIRLPAFLSGLLLVPAICLVGRALYNNSAALMAAGLVAVSSELVEFSTNARGYSVQALLFLISLWLGLYILRTKNIRVWMLLGTVWALGFYAIPTMIYGFGIVFLWLGLEFIVRFRGQERIILLRMLTVAAIFAGALTLVLYTPVFIRSGLKAVFANKWVQPEEWHVFISSTLPALGQTWANWNRDVPFVLAVILMIGFLVALAFHLRLSKTVIPLAPLAVLWCGLVLLIQRVTPFSRVWTFLIPLYLLLASVGFVSMVDLGLRHATMRLQFASTPLLTLSLCAILGSIILTTNSIYLSPETNTVTDANAIILFLKSTLKSGVPTCIIAPNRHIFQYYGQMDGLDYTKYLGCGASQTDLALVVIQDGDDSSDSALFKAVQDRGLRSDTSIKPQPLMRFEYASLYQVKILH